MNELYSMTAAQVSEAVQELDAVADALGMPLLERCSILGLNGYAYRTWYDGAVKVPAAPELMRRLNYALPLMRRMVANTPRVTAGRSQNRPRHAAN